MNDTVGLTIILGIPLFGIFIVTPVCITFIRFIEALNDQKEKVQESNNQEEDNEEIAG